MIHSKTGMDKNTVCCAVNEVCGNLIHSNDLTKLIQSLEYLGILLVDGKYCSVKKRKKGCVAISFMDYHTHDIPIHIFAHSENKHDIREGFKLLKELGYPLKILVCDESMGEIAMVAKEFFHNVIIQHCLTHYMKNVEKELRVKSVARRIKSLEKALKSLGGSVLIPTRGYDLEKARAIQNEISDLEFQYLPLIQIHKIFQKIFWKAKSSEDLNLYEDQLNEIVGNTNMSTYKHADRIRKRYTDYYQKRARITAFIDTPNVPKTTNLIEGFHSQLELRLTSFKGFETEKSAENYINALILKRRFQKFTDCRFPFKKLNGFSPIQAANPSNNFPFNFDSDNWIDFCLNLKK